MAGLKEIKSRIRSVKNTKKITYAMKLVSATKLKRAQEAVESSREYTLALGSLVARLVQEQQSGDFSHPLLSESGDEQNVMLIIVGGNRGLCGGYNSNVNKAVAAFYQQNQGKNIRSICLGRKPVEFFKRKKIQLDKAYDDLQEDPNTWPIDDVMAEAERAYLSQEVDAVYVVYTKFYSALSMVVETQKFLPFSAEQLMAEAQSGQENVTSGSVLFEPSVEDVLAEIIPRIVAGKFRQACLEAKAGEQGSRMTAMDSATKNASDLIESLTRTQNKLRQSGITSQILDIIGGAEGLK